MYSHIPQGLTRRKSTFCARKVSLHFEQLAGRRTSSAAHSIKNEKFCRFTYVRKFERKQNILKKILYVT